LLNLFFRFLQTGKGYFTIAFGNPGKAALSCVASLIAAIPSELHKIAFAHVKRRLKIEKIQTSIAKLKFPFQPFAKGPQANNKFLQILPDLTSNEFVRNASTSRTGIDLSHVEILKRQIVNYTIRSCIRIRMARPLNK
jgi:hypothetical protein